jgi:hypothetical protein
MGRYRPRAPPSFTPSAFVSTPRLRKSSTRALLAVVLRIFSLSNVPAHSARLPHPTPNTRRAGWADFLLAPAPSPAEPNQTSPACSATAVAYGLLDAATCPGPGAAAADDTAAAAYEGCPAGADCRRGFLCSECALP